VLAAAARHVDFTLDSGHRTMGEQHTLHERSRRSGAPAAALPTAGAPHIRIGRANHAIDVDALDGGAARVVVWLRERGARASLPVRGQPWHIEVPAADLQALAAQLSAEAPVAAPGGGGSSLGAPV